MATAETTPVSIRDGSINVIVAYDDVTFVVDKVYIKNSSGRKVDMSFVNSVNQKQSLSNTASLGAKQDINMTLKTKKVLHPEDSAPWYDLGISVKVG